ncbi:extracellular solute-binding protein [Paenibacillus filicis]|uniref:Extracellular solute-binding protein n=1 Tax=Paenibacillus filicis TaxID=669464 RepID=A0ABU9DJK0_9BACL
MITRSSRLLCLTLALVVMAGCTGKSPTEENKPPASTNNGQKDITIKFHHWQNTQDEKLDLVIAEFEKLNPGIKVESIRLEAIDSTESLKKLDLLAASGEQLDVVMMPSNITYAQRVGMGMLEPLNPFLEKEGVKFDDEYKLDTKMNGAYYALPGHLMPDMVLLNMDHLKEANLPVPTDWTFDEFFEYARILTKGEGTGKRFGTYIHNWAASNTFALRSQPEQNMLINADESSNVTSPALRKSLEILKQTEMVDKSAMAYADIVSQKLHYAWPYFNGKASMQILGGYMLTRVGGYDKYPATFRTAFAPFPKISKDDPNYAPVSETLYLSVAAASKNKEASYKFIRYYTTQGFSVQGKYLGAWKKLDVDKEIDNIISHTQKPEFVDGQSFKNVMSKVKFAKLGIPPTYYNEIIKAYNEEVELFLLGNQDIDTTIKKTDEKVKKIAKLNQK